MPANCAELGQITLLLLALKSAMPIQLMPMREVSAAGIKAIWPKIIQPSQ